MCWETVAPSPFWPKSRAHDGQAFSFEFHFPSSTFTSSTVLDTSPPPSPLHSSSCTRCAATAYSSVGTGCSCCTARLRPCSCLGKFAWSRTSLPRRLSRCHGCLACFRTAQDRQLVIALARLAIHPPAEHSLLSGLCLPATPTNRSDNSPTVQCSLHTQYLEIDNLASSRSSCFRGKSVVQSGDWL